MNDVTSLQLIIGREDENEYIEIDLNEYNEKYKRLQQKIDKAIEYIENNQLVFQESTKEEIEDWFKTYYKELLDILKGNDNNEGK